MAMPPEIIYLIFALCYNFYFLIAVMIIHQWGGKKIYRGHVIDSEDPPTSLQEPRKHAPSSGGEGSQKIALTGFCVNVGADMGSTFVNPMA